MDWWAATAVFAAEIVLLGAFVQLPRGFWAGYVHERAWGLSSLSVGRWEADRATSLVVEIVLAGLVAAGLVASAWRCRARGPSSLRRWLQRPCSS